MEECGDRIVMILFSVVEAGVTLLLLLLLCSDLGRLMVISWEGSWPRVGISEVRMVSSFERACV